MIFRQPEIKKTCQIQQFGTFFVASVALRRHTHALGSGTAPISGS
ncbi:hypothetical protein SAMN02746062_00824 [Alysiella filiformis DSM 16848]|uniref:Uncharacterized protein n=2 Tax=Alysiella TaxID=194195 RepID=A0A286E8F9_9NEIS|nr:hypothetical protein SAMN02746062_00824 [Alysiella filiformis DSM 16848]